MKRRLALSSVALTLAGAAGEARAQTSGLVAAYAFNEGSGSSIADASGRGNAGMIANATWTTQGRYGNALAFNGTSARVNVPDSASLHLTTGMTLEAWVRPSAVSSAWRDVVYKGNDNYYLEGTSRSGGVPAAGGTFGGVYGTSPLPANTWTHLAVTYDRANMRLYVNGAQVSSVPKTANIATSTNPLQIGGDSIYGQYFQGTIDEVRVYNVALTPAQIQADMTTPIGAVAPDTQPPTAPGALAATAVGANQINLSWTASTDNVGVTGYRVERCQGVECTGFTQIATPSGTTYGDAGLLVGTTYRYQVRATDAAGNLGPYSNAASATTSAPDTEPPTAPGALAASAVGINQINLTWTASTDNVSVAGYRVERCQGAGCTGFAEIATPTGTTYSDAALLPGTTYRYQVRATDAAGNLGPYSNVASATTLLATSGLVAAYAFDEGLGPAVVDASGQGNAGTIANATWTTQGKYGSALAFNGTNARITIPDSASLHLTTGMTLEAWVKPSTVNNAWRDVVYKGNDNYFLEGTSTSSSVPGAGGTFGEVYGTAPLPANTWTHVAVTYDRANLRLFVNGTQVSSVAKTTTMATSTNPLQIGGDGIYGQYFQGVIDEVRVYNVALAPAQIQADMATPIGSGGPPLPDTQPPTVLITSPLPGSSLTGTFTLTASATDTGTGVGGVQFQVDGVNVGAPDTTASYSFALNTAQFTNAAHTIGAYAWDNVQNVGTADGVTVTFSNSSPGRPDQTGLWSGLFSWPMVAVHAHLLRTGQVLMSDGQSLGNSAAVWDPRTSSFRDASLADNIFCAGHAALADGRIFVAGGHGGGHIGITDANIFDPMTQSWTSAAPMTYRRWYPAVTTLPDGRALVTLGETSCDACQASIPEIYDPATNRWTVLSTANLALPYYPHMYLLPDGRIYAAATSEAPITTHVLDLGTQSWSVVESSGNDGGSSAMYLPGKILKAGTSADPDNPPPSAAKTAYVIDMTQPSPSWRPVSSMAFNRTYHTLTLLPDGNVLATGGGTTTNAVGTGNAVLPAELWSPATEGWTTLAAMHAPRLYHSVGLLLPDARVLVAGGGRFNGINEPTDQPSGEIFAPPYLFKGPRPTISVAPGPLAYNQVFTVQTPDAANIAKVVLMGTASVTHNINMNQRHVPLSFTAGSGSLSVTAPANANLAPPGYYMLFIIDANGVPSVAAFVKLS